jgi:nucleotidyltransferase/DNA polymerase involved in DNA repair
MSGAEVITVPGLISSVITIIETSQDIYDAASSAEGLHEAFRVVSQNIPLVLNILHDCKKAQEQVDKNYSLTVNDNLKRDIEESNKAIEPLIKACQENANRLQDIFQQVVPEGDASRVKRYKVEDLMIGILEKLQLLHTSRFFKSENEQKNEKNEKELKTAISQLSELSSSLPENEGQCIHYGLGAMFIYPGDGMQHNYRGSGQTQHLGKEE